MDSELNSLLNSIKEKTGIDIAMYSESMKYFVSTNEAFKPSFPEGAEFDGILTDTANKKTYFKIKYRNAKLLGIIDGSDKMQENYAFLILKLLENSSNKEMHLSQVEYLKSILLGECSRAQIQKYMRKFNVSAAPCFVMVISNKENRNSDIINVLNNFATNSADTAVIIEEGIAAFVKFMDESGLAEYQSPNEYANFLLQSIYEETGAAVQIAIGGTVPDITDISTSFLQAMSTMRMSGAMSNKSKVHSFKEFLLIKMLEDIPKFKLNEYLEILLDNDAKTVFADDDMINTAEEFLENNLNVSETSRKLFLHRNTLMYRLDKIERATGLNIRKFSDAVTFRLITILYKLLK